jgi:hypothetical protein
MPTAHLLSWLDTPPPYKVEMPPPYTMDDLSPSSHSASRSQQTTESIAPPTQYMKLTCRDGDLWIGRPSWVITPHLPSFRHPWDYETFVGTLRRIHIDDVRALMLDRQPCILPMLLDRLERNGFTELFDKMDANALRTLCDLMKANFYPREAWLKRRFVHVMAMAAVLRVHFQNGLMHEETWKFWPRKGVIVQPCSLISHFSTRG